MKDAPTLADELYRATFARRPGAPCQIVFVDFPDRLRQDLRDARKFVLDDEMSAFLVDLSSAAFMKRGTAMPSLRLAHRLVDQMRTLARLPHRLTWVEYNYFRATDRAAELGLVSLDPGSGPEAKFVGLGSASEGIARRTKHQGWLINQHPSNETLFRVHIFDSFSDFPLMMAPLAFAWHTDDEPSVWTGKVPKGSKDKISAQSEFAVGVPFYRSDRCGVVFNGYMDDWFKEHDPRKLEMFNLSLRTHSGALRRVWALLGAVNDIPVEARTVAPSKGFIGRGAYRRFLEHKVITLRIPGDADKVVVARKIIARARVRAHQVRGHWRRDHWRAGERIWVHEHVRGDASLGVVIHDYSVEHEREPT